jgi:hypothetical protein
MVLNPRVDLPHVIFGFGVVLFLALACLLRLQYRRQLLKKARLERGLRTYVSNEKQEVA